MGNKGTRIYFRLIAVIIYYEISIKYVHFLEKKSFECLIYLVWYKNVNLCLQTNVYITNNSL